MKSPSLNFDSTTSQRFFSECAQSRQQKKKKNLGNILKTLKIFRDFHFLKNFTSHNTLAAVLLSTSRQPI